MRIKIGFIFMIVMLMCTACLGSAQIESEIIRLEAEEGRLSGPAQIINGEAYSSGKKVGYMGANGSNNPDIDGAVTFQTVITTAGMYTLNLKYCSGSSDRYFYVTVNNQERQKVLCPSTGGFEEVGEIEIEVELKAGENSITFGCIDWYAPDLDCIELSPVREENTNRELNRIKFEAEDGVVSNGAVVDTYAQHCSKGGKVDNIGGDSNGSLQLEGIQVEKEGKYALLINYCSAQERGFEIKVNQEKALYIHCPASRDWDIPVSTLITMDLKAGENTITFSNSKGYAPNLDSIELYQCQTIENQELQLIYDVDNGVYSMLNEERLILQDAYSNVQLDEKLSSLDYKERTIKIIEIEDEFGKGMMLTAMQSHDELPLMKQQFKVYDKYPYILVGVELEDNTELASNWMAPVVIDKIGALNFNEKGEKYILEVPFDNDGWVSFNPQPISSKGISHEVTALYDQNTSEGIIMGSITHDKWKTGIEFKGSNGRLQDLSIYGGANNVLTRDQSPHGLVTGKVIQSPVILIGYYDDWKEGLDSFAQANTILVPKKESVKKVPMGWNSWGTIQTHLNYDIATYTSDYIKENYQEEWTKDNHIVYINLDSYWDNMDDEELRSFVQHCKANGQKAGIYWAPFVTWHGYEGLSNVVENTNGQYTYLDCVLRKANGEMYDNSLDGAYPLDVTHPAVKARIDYYIDRFKSLGFEYIKLDFLGHGALEGQHEDRSVETGIQAYNQGMQYVVDQIDGKMFINLAISPTFPYQYADGRRLACDTYWKIHETEYQLNALTYGFWQKNLYNYPDPDHLVIDGNDGIPNLEEARSRVNSGIISGTSFLSGDDFRKDMAKEYGEILYNNKDLVELAKVGKIFKPVSPDPKKRSAETFFMQDGNHYYLAVFNFSDRQKEGAIDLEKCGILRGDYQATNLWTGEKIDINHSDLVFSLAAKDSTLFKIKLK